MPFVSLSLVNTSAHTSYRVVRPAAWEGDDRPELRVFLSSPSAPRAEDEPDLADLMGYSRWGGPDRWPGVVVLGPGGRLSVGRVAANFQLDQPGRAILVAHYQYRGGPRTEPLGVLRRMAGVPPFEVASDPIPVEVVRPFEVRLKVKRGVKAYEKLRLSDLFEAEMVNPSAAPLDLGRADANSPPGLWIEQDAQYGLWRPSVESRGPHPGLVRTLPAGGRVPLLGPGRFDGDWVYPAAETFRVRAVYSEGGDNKRVAVKSDWVEVRVEP